MIELEIKFDAKWAETSLLAAVGTKTRQTAVATALTRTAALARVHVAEKINTIFDRPTPFTQHSARYGIATAETLRATVYISDDANRGLSPRKYLGPEMRGGLRNDKKSDVALKAVGAELAGQEWVPSRQAPLDQYGNVSGGRIFQIMSRLGAVQEMGFQANVSEKRKARLAKLRMAAAASKTEYFVAHSKRDGEPLGVWQLVGPGKVRPVLIFANRRPHYPVRFAMDDIVAAFAKTHFHAELARTLLERIARGAL